MDTRTRIPNHTGPEKRNSQANWTTKGLFGYVAVFAALLLLPVAPDLVAAAIVGAAAPRAIAKLDGIVGKRQPSARSTSAVHQA